MVLLNDIVDDSAAGRLSYWFLLLQQPVRSLRVRISDLGLGIRSELGLALVLVLGFGLGFGLVYVRAECIYTN